MKKYFLFFVLLFSFGAPTEAFAQINPHFKNWGVTGNFSLFEMWVLNKYGISGFYTENPDWNFELEYMKGSLGFGYFGIDIGKIKEERLSFIARSFAKRNSLNFMYGIFYNKMEIGLSQRLLSTVSSVARPNVDQIELSMAGLTWGVGNRWQTREGYILGIDWFVINLPLSIIQEHTPFFKQSQDANERDNVQDSLRWLKKIPSAGILKIQVGLSF